MAASCASESRAHRGQAVELPPYLRAAARNANSRVSTFSSRPGSTPSPSTQVDRAPRLGGFDDGPVERRHRGIEPARRLVGTALQQAQRRVQPRQPRPARVDRVAAPSSASAAPRHAHHRRSLGEFALLARARIERAQFVRHVMEIFEILGARATATRPRTRSAVLGRRERAQARSTSRHLVAQPPERIEQIAMRRRRRAAHDRHAARGSRAARRRPRA